MTTHGALGWTGVLLASAGLASCTVERTQLLVGVDTELSWGPTGMIQSVTLEMRRGDANGALRSRRTTALGEANSRQGLPLWVTVVSMDESDTSPLWVEALGCARPDGCTRSDAVVAQWASVRFVPRETGVLRLLLAGACVSRRCAQSERCEVLAGQCIGVDAQGEVRAYGGVLPGRWADASVGSDVAVVDAAVTDAVTDRSDDVGSDVGAVDVGGPPVCGSGTHACSGTCVSDTAVSSCGASCTPCAAPTNGTATCSDGVCGVSCNAGYANCDGNAANGCEVNLNSDIANCGACTRACPGAQLCSAGTCVTSCVSGQTNCSSACRDLATDPDSCGACGMVCSGSGVVSRTCSGSACSGACSAGRANCDGNVQSNGCETDIATSVATCGGCSGMACSGNNIVAACSGGTCTGTCNAGFADCDSDKRTNGCETNTSANASSCGGCGASFACPTRANASSTPCVGSACTIGSCNAGYANCDGNAGNGCEVNTATTTTHCGACGLACSAGQSCVSGTCTTWTTSMGQRSCTPTVAGCGLVAITGGTFTQGGLFPALSALPVQAGITVGNFSLDAYEVTVARFNAFWSVRAAALTTIRSAPIAYPGGQSIAWGAAAASPASQGGGASADTNWSATSTSRDAHPMNRIDWWLSQEFCVWDGGRLPTEAEWEYAARGRTGAGLSTPRIYPWGNEDPGASCERALWISCAGTDGGRTRRVGGFAASGGLFDMAGNVWEWTADNWGDYPSCGGSITNPLCNNNAAGARVIRGGSWRTTTNHLRSASRYFDSAASGNGDIGFRCARTTP